MANRVRGIRQTIAAGYILGRVGLTPGPAQPVRIGAVLQGSGAGAAIRAHQTDNTINGTAVQVDDTITLADKVLLQYILANDDWEYKSLSAVLDGISSTRGSIVYRNATTWVALAPGTSGYVLSTNGAGADPAWIIQNSGGSNAFHPGFASGQYYTAPLINTTTTFVLSANTLYALPFYVPATTTFTKASVRVSTTDAGKLVEIGVYANGNGVPTTLEFDCGNVSTTASGQIELTGLSLILTAGWHWLVLASNSAVVSLFSTGSADAIMGTLLGFNTPNTVTTGITGTWTFSAGALPASFPAVSYVTNAKQPLAWLRL